MLFKHLNDSFLLLGETNKLKDSLCLTCCSILKEHHALLVTEDSHFSLRTNLGSRDFTKDSLKFNLNIWRFVDHLSVKTCFINPSLENDNDVSSTKKHHSHIDGSLGEKSVFVLK